MSRHRDNLESKVYVGELARDASEKDIERAFNYYGPLRNVWVAHNPPGFAFVEFEDVRDAEDAVRALDGSDLCGSRIRVEFSTGKVRSKQWQNRDSSPWRRGGGGGGGGGGRRPFNSNDCCYECGERGHYAYDCRRRGGGGRGGGGGRRRSRSRSRSRSNDRRRSTSRSRSR